MTRKYRVCGSLAVLLAAALAVTGRQAKDRAGDSTDVEATTLRFALTGDLGSQITARADDGKTLTLRNPRGGTCGDALAWTTTSWARQ
jgi:hypothetical protein